MLRVRHSHWRVPLLVALAAVGCSLCKDSDVETKLSPDQKLAVTVFHRDCGATTAEMTLVMLHNRDESYDSGKNRILVSKGSNAVDVSWDSNTSLRVHCFNCRPDDITLQIVKFAGVTITYEP